MKLPGEGREARLLVARQSYFSFSESVFFPFPGMLILAHGSFCPRRMGRNGSREEPDADG